MIAGTIYVRGENDVHLDEIPRHDDQNDFLGYVSKYTKKPVDYISKAARVFSSSILFSNVLEGRGIGGNVKTVFKNINKISFFQTLYSIEDLTKDYRSLFRHDESKWCVGVDIYNHFVTLGNNIKTLAESFQIIEDVLERIKGVILEYGWNPLLDKCYELLKWTREVKERVKVLQEIIQDETYWDKCLAFAKTAKVFILVSDLLQFVQEVCNVCSIVHLASTLSGCVHELNSIREDNLQEKKRKIQEALEYAKKTLFDSERVDVSKRWKKLLKLPKNSPLASRVNKVNEAFLRSHVYQSTFAEGEELVQKLYARSKSELIHSSIDVATKVAGLVVTGIEIANKASVIGCAISVVRAVGSLGLFHRKIFVDDPFMETRVVYDVRTRTSQERKRSALEKELRNLVA